MLKKIERGTMFIQTQSDLFRCPTCHQMMHAQEKALVCLEGHRFDVSKKGTLYFLNHQIKTDYDREMFEHRRKLIVHGMYQPLLDLLQPFCQNQRILDVGCGEGSFLQQLNEQATLSPSVGFDISKEGIYLASD